MPTELPVIYENPRFDAATPTFWPVINRAIRYGAFMMAEWGSLTLIEDAPRYLKIATVVIAVLILAVHESWPWLRMRNKYLYPILMAVLVLAYTGIFGFAFYTEPAKHPAIALTPDELARAMRRELPDLFRPPAPASGPVAAAASSPPFVSPFHDNLTKWNIVEGVRSQMLRNGLSPECHVIIVRLQETYPEDFSMEFMRLLDVIGWKYEERFATKTVPKDVTVVTIDYRQTPELRSQPAPGMECAQALSGRFQNAAHTRRGNQFNNVLRWVSYDEAPDYLKQCGRQCFEVDFGKEDTSR
jgi:hypothetical protein